MHKTPRHRPRPGVQILVAAPHGEIHVPRVQRQRDIADGVREVPANVRDAEGARVGSDEGDVEELACVVLDAGEEEEGGGGGVGGDGGEDGGGGNLVAGGGGDFDEGGGGGEVVEVQVGLDCVLWGVSGMGDWGWGAGRTRSVGKGFHSMIILWRSAVGR